MATSINILTCNQEVLLTDISVDNAGYGHKKITVELCKDGEYKSFSATTDNMPMFDKADELEGTDRMVALFEIIENKIEGSLCFWLDNLTENN